MSLTWRRFAGPDDTGALITLMRRMKPWNERGIGWLHPGDVVWRLYQNLSTTPEDEMRIVVDDLGVPLALVELVEPDTYCIHMPADAGDVAEVIRFAAGHAEQELRALPVKSAGEPLVTIVAEVLSVQPYAAEILQSLGYEPASETHYRLNVQAVGHDLPALILPEGVTVRAVREDPADLAGRVEVHRAVWTTSKLTIGGYERLRTKPLYRGDLDLVVETAQGDLAAYCVVWWDPVTKASEFEPVGTVERFRGRGYGKAVLLEGLRRLGALGTEHATVISGMDPDNEPARRLYRSAGFKPAFTFEEWKKPIPGDA